MTGFVLESIEVTGDPGFVLESIVAETSTMTLVTDIDAGNVSAGSTTITDADTAEPTVNLAHRTDAGDWRHLHFAVENAEGKRPIFKAPRSTRYNNPTPSTEYRPVWTQDFVTWTRAPSRTLTGGTSGTIDWQFTDPLPAGRVYVATQPLGRQADAVALTTRLLTDYPSVISPAASSDAGGVFFTSPVETDGIGRAVGGHPLYGLKARFGGSTTDGGPKRKLVVISGIHAAGEQTCWIPFVRFLNFVLDSSDAAAVAVRANWDIDLYYNITPNGVYSGHNRTNPSRSGDPNRIWDAPNVEIAATQAAILDEIDGGRFDAFFSWHGFSSETKPFLMYLTSAEYNSGTRSALTQAFIDEGTTLFGVTPTLETSGTNNTDVWWALTNGAAVAIDTEVQQNGSTAPETYQHIGESWAKTLAAVDAADEFWAPSENASGEVSALSLVAPAGSAATTTAASGALAVLSLTAPAGASLVAATATGSVASISLVAPSGLVAPSVSASGSLAGITLAAPAGASATSAAGSGAVASISLVAPNGDASTETETFASGSIASITLAAPAGTALPSASASGALASLSLTAPNGDASTEAEVFASGALAAINLTAPTGTHSAAVSAPGVLAGISLTAPNGDASTLSSTTASGAIASLTVVAPSGAASASAAATGAVAPISLTTPNGTVSTVAETFAPGSIASVGLTPPEGAQAVETAASGAVSGITLIAVTGTADTLAWTFAEGALPAITLTAPSGTHGVDVAGAGAMAGITIVAPNGRGFDPVAAGETVLGYATRTRDVFVVTRTKDIFVRVR